MFRPRALRRLVSLFPQLARVQVYQGKHHCLHFMPFFTIHPVIRCVRIRRLTRLLYTYSTLRKQESQDILRKYRAAPINPSPAKTHMAGSGTLTR